MKNILEDLEILILQNEDDFDRGSGKFILRNFIKEKQAKQLILSGVVVPKGTCCLKPKKIGKVNDMFESWDECKNCGKEVL